MNIRGLVSTVDFSTWEREFRAYDRWGTFSHAGHRALFEYLEELADDIGSIEFDVISICCDYAEYSSLTEFQQDYDPDGEFYNSVDDIANDTAVIHIESIYTDYKPLEEHSPFIIQAF